MVYRLIVRQQIEICSLLIGIQDVFRESTVKAVKAHPEVSMQRLACVLQMTSDTLVHGLWDETSLTSCKERKGSVMAVWLVLPFLLTIALEEHVVSPNSTSFSFMAMHCVGFAKDGGGTLLSRNPPIHADNDTIVKAPKTCNQEWIGIVYIYIWI